MRRPLAYLSNALARKRNAHVVQCLSGIAIALLIALVGVELHINLLIASLLYLLAVVAFAVHFGFWQASVVSVVAMLCQTYWFAPPAFSFYISDRRNGLAIIIFEVIALVVSRVSVSEKSYAIESELKHEKIQRLYRISQGALLLNLRESLERQMAELILREFHLEAVAIVNTCLDSAGTAGRWTATADEIDECLRKRDPVISAIFASAARCTLVSNKGPVGTLLVIGDVTPLDLDSLSTLITLAMERNRALLQQGTADAARRTEQLRTTVLDGLAHAFKTPLTIVRAASSGLLESGRLDEQQQLLTQMIDQQSIHLDELTNRLLQTARVGSENLCLQLEAVDIAALIHEIVDDVRQAWPDRNAAFSECPPIHLSIPVRLRPLAADHDMIASTIRELLDNAVKYSSTGSSVHIAASQTHNELTVSVQSFGPIIGIEDRDRIFEMFYRGMEHRHSAPGTGIGLSVARRVMEAHNGRIWVTSSEATGTVFYLSLPRTLPIHGPQPSGHDDGN